MPAKFLNAGILGSSPQRCAHDLFVGCEHGIKADTCSLNLDCTGAYRFE